ncbi:MgtC/SapB family protein [Salegentibacter sp. F188]|uniref:MgtC/SapB family protein n=1 Tax=Autumnicola patrickiae TaxID=3075591 RepID=A0ABU3E431_9FLAO|nr:MgtC/SapB family protein [Salegentibacter sp. F188]MDT0690741.1 MgtC/SapB family protein [Salegentibacter sp. F188]
MDWQEFALRIGLAAVAGLVIGLEREVKGKSAGLRTNCLVAVGSCVFILLSLRFLGNDEVDITRVLGQVVVGIGFIGAGTIIQRGKDVKGLTTAATTWCSAAVGCVAGFGLFEELIALSVLVLGINLGFSFIERKLMSDEEKEKESEL